MEKSKRNEKKYIILELDDSGKYDKVKILLKDELSDEDLAYMKKENNKYQEWQKAESLYYSDHPMLGDDKWWGPEDSEYDADIKKYLGREKGFLPEKIYTKKEIGEKLQDMILKEEGCDIIGRWFYRLRLYNIKDRDESLDDLIYELEEMSIDFDLTLLNEKLYDISEKLIKGGRINFSWDNQVLS